MINKLSKTLLFTIIFILYHMQMIFSPFSDAIVKCTDEIFNEFGFDKYNGKDLKHKFAKHAMENNLEHLLTSTDAKEYFKYIPSEIYVDEELPHPEAFCDKIGADFDPTLPMAAYYWKQIVTERIRCKHNLLDLFPHYSDVAEIAKAVFKNTLNSYFTPMLDTNYGKKYYSVLVDGTYFYDKLLSPSKYCQTKHMLTRTADNSYRKDPGQTSGDGPIAFQKPL